MANIFQKDFRDLIKAKKKAGRIKDLDDINQLQKKNKKQYPIIILNK